MNHELLILRHGKSDWGIEADDFRRPLMDRGKRGAQKMAIWLLQHDLVPDYIVSSPAMRAIVTAEKTCKAMGLGVQVIHQEIRVYEAEPGGLLDVLRDCPEKAARVLLVGHNPGLEELLVFLADEKVLLPDDGKLLPTATLARLDVSGKWKDLDQAGCRLLSITRPADLPKKFPFPDHGSSELRDRPAYYYTQSSVIPYRRHQGQVEMLVISSSKKKHWVVPKGIAEPGISPRESAAIEAWEEAGIEGEVGEASIGSYSYQKWGATCTVEVYPMEVTRVLPENEWEESHRGRDWVTPEQAASRLKQKELKPMVTALARKLEKETG